MTGNHLLDTMAAADRERLLTRVKRVAFGQGETLAEAGAHVAKVWFPVSGVVSLVSPFEDGSAVEVASIGREGAVGALAACGAGVSSMRAMAKHPGEAWVVDARTFCSVHDGSASLRRTIAHYSEVILTEARQEIACRTRHSTDARLARTLLEHSDRSGTDALPMSQELLSSLVGIQRTTVNAAARTLKASGAIRYSRGVIEVASRARLEGQACECYAAMRAFRNAMTRPEPDEAGNDDGPQTRDASRA
ncbi:CRP-like cAMP-binding protein [Brevundimonas alba]|uniref:CRP-like cAMP-binding protein n=1 Tax=Brevundimonas alba TaxID=74314 RepID=A0A7X5YKA2_9CAUL|nr:Crp/Fnr family transcriptional regulator [Brevundimonas alba]NJC40786.1 CRP-like cAMP-binding protein [Brevundimonas alba]